MSELLELIARLIFWVAWLVILCASVVAVIYTGTMAFTAYWAEGAFPWSEVRWFLASVLWSVAASEISERISE